MTGAPGSLVFGDIGYWAELRCAQVGALRCEAALERLKSVRVVPLGNGERVADRLMFGSDWLMLSRENADVTTAVGKSRASRTSAAHWHRKSFGHPAARAGGEP